MKIGKALSLLLACSLACTGAAYGQETTENTDSETDIAISMDVTGSTKSTSEEEQAYIEETLNLANNEEVTWSYMEDADAWVMSIVSAVAYPELPDQRMDAEPADHRHQALKERVDPGDQAFPAPGHVRFVQPVGDGHGESIHGQADPQQYTV